MGLWLPDWYKEQRRVRHKSARESAIYEKLKKGPEFGGIEATIERKSLVDEIRSLITPTESKRPYPLIVGEQGTGKTSLIQLAVNSMDKDKPKGVVYVDLPLLYGSEIDIATAIQKALGWSPDPVIDSDKRKCRPSLPVCIFEANRFAAVPVRDLLDIFSSVALKYRQDHGKVPVLIIDNANKLAQNQQEFLDVFQDYAKDATDKGIATVVFVSNEGHVPRRMIGKSFMPMVLFINYYLLN